MNVKYGEHFGWSLLKLEEEPDLEMDEVLECIDHAIQLTIREPYHAKALKREPLIGYRSRHFHSKRRPPEKMQPDLRLIYRVEKDTLYLEVVGRRRPREKALDIYTRFERILQQAKEP